MDDSGKKWDLKIFIKKNNMYLIFVILLVACIFLSEDFLTVNNIINIGRQQAGLIIISMGLLYVIETGGIDLGSGAIMALSSVMVTFCLTTHEIGMFAAIVIPLLLGALFGLISEIFVSWMNMAPFIVTLAIQIMARGLAYVISNGNPVMAPTGTIEHLGTGTFLNIPFLIWLALIIVLLFWFVQRFTTFGRMVLATGSNETAVYLAGIRVKWYKTGTYVIAGICSAVAGIISVSRTGIGTPQVGVAIESDAIAACVIGGANMMGGEGDVPKAVVGVFVLALIRNIMNLMAVPSYPQDVIKGIIIILAVLLQTVTSQKR